MQLLAFGIALFLSRMYHQQRNAQFGQLRAPILTTVAHTSACGTCNRPRLFPNPSYRAVVSSPEAGHRIYSARSQNNGKPTVLLEPSRTGPNACDRTGSFFTWMQSLPAPNNAHSIRISKLPRSIAPADVEVLLHDAGVEMYVAFL